MMTGSLLQLETGMTWSYAPLMAGYCAMAAAQVAVLTSWARTTTPESELSAVMMLR
jgi:hypothetical protein